MEYIFLNKNAVKIIISKSELDKMNVTFEGLINDNKKATILFECVAKGLDHSFFKNSLVEIFNLDENGVVVYFCKKPDACIKNKNLTVTFETKKPELLCGMCNKLKSLLSDKNEGVLYCDDENYRLVIKIPPEDSEGIKKLVNKYKIYAKTGDIIPSLMSEHSEIWKILIPDNAVNVLSEGF